jgi:DNA-binding NtrC family response regulator
LIACCDAANSRVIEETTRGCMLEILTSTSLSEARGLAARSDVAIIFCDDLMPDGSYRDLLAAMPKTSHRVPLIVVMSQEDRDQVYREAMEGGAFDVIASPCSRQDVQWVVIRAMDLR